VGVDTSPAFILLFRALSALQQCVRDEIAPSSVRVTVARESGLPSAKRDFSCARGTYDVGLALRAHSRRGCALLARARARVCVCVCARVRARAHIGAIISHHASAYVIPATESTPAAVGFACCLCLSAGGDHVSMVSDAFNGF